MKNKLCINCGVIILPKRLADYPRATSCDSICSFAIREGMTRREAIIYRLREAKAAQVLKGEGPWPEPDPEPKLNEFGLPKEGRAFES